MALDNWRAPTHTRATSQVESAYHELKSYLEGSQADLYLLYEIIDKMLLNKRLRLEREVGRETVILRHTWRNNPLLQEVFNLISFKACELLHDQVLGVEAILKGQRPSTKCTGRFRLQFGLPCRHELIPRLRLEIEGTDRPIYLRATGEGPLKIEEINRHWLLARPLASSLGPVRI